MQQLGDCIIGSCASLPDAELTSEVEADARRNAAAVFKQSVQAYQKVGMLPCWCCTPLASVYMSAVQECVAARAGQKQMA